MWVEAQYVFRHEVMPCQDTNNGRPLQIIKKSKCQTSSLYTRICVESQYNILSTLETEKVY